MIARAAIALTLLIGSARAGTPTVYVFGASWCPHCVAAKPIVQRLRDEGYPIYSLDVDEAKAKQLAADCKVSKIPAFVLADEDERTGAKTYSGKNRLAGEQSEKLLRQFFKKHNVKPISKR